MFVWGKKMSFDISRLTNAVNKYLNSISDIGRQASQQAQEIADKTQFQTDLSEAIKANIQSKTRDVDTIPDIGAMVQNEIKSATAGIDSTFEQINGAFLEISEAGKNSSLAKDNSAAVQVADKSAGGNSATADKSTKSGNADAYAGRLSTDALKELSGSGYFSGNMIVGSLFKTDDEDSSSSSASSNAFSTMSLDQLNVNSLLANSLGVNTTASEALTEALKTAGITASGKEGAAASGQSTGQTSGTDVASGNDLAKALIKAYTSAAKNSATTSVFGDFSL